MIEVAEEGIVLFGFSVALLGTMRDTLPDRSVLVVEEPDVAQARGADALAAGCPAVSRVIRAPYQDPAGLDRLLGREPAILRASAVLPGGEYAVVPAAVVADRIGVPGAGVAAARTLRDKYELRRVSSRAGIANPGYALVERVEDAERFFRLGGGRACVLKPTARQASAGVQIITEEAQIRRGWQASLDPSEGHRVPGRGVPSRVLLEHAVHGPEFSVEQLVSGHRPVFVNVTAKQVLPGRFPVELGHVVPAPVTPQVRASLERAAERLVRATGFRHGILHSEWIVADGVPTLVEAGARMPGDEIGMLISDAWRFDLSQAFVRLMSGERIDVPRSPAGAAAIAFLVLPPGRVLAVEGVDDVRGMPGVCDVRLSVAEGTVVAPVTSSWDRAGYVRVRAGSAEQAQRWAQDAVAALRVTVCRSGSEPAPSAEPASAGPAPSAVLVP